MMFNIFVGVLGSIAGAVITLLIQEVIVYLKSRKGELTGEWEQRIFNNKGKVIKKDKVIISHVGNRLKGTIQRIEPKDQNYKRWRFEGYIRGRLFFGCFWPENPARNPNSYGTLQLYLVGENKMEGFYVRLHVSRKDGGPRFIEELRPVPFEWVKQ